MYERFLAIALYTILIFTLLLLEVSVFPALFFTRDPFDLLFVTALSFSLLFRYSSGLLLASIGGVLFDIILLAPGRESVGLLLALIITNVLFLRFFTNKSLWTLLLLGGVGTIILRLVSALLRLSFVHLFSLMAMQLVTHSILFIFFFSTLHLLGTRLKPYLLIKEHA